jgi:hypothetical protein
LSRVHEVERDERPDGHTNTVPQEGLGLATGWLCPRADGLERGKPEISFPLPMALAIKTLGAMPGALSRRYAARLSKRLRAR